jgi:hypothetical protein
MIPQSDNLVGFVDDPGPFHGDCTAMELPRFVAVKVNKMLGMADRVNKNSLLDHEFSRRLGALAKFKSVTAAP